MWMYKVQSIATSENKVYEDGEVIPKGVLVEDLETGELTGQPHAYYTTWSDALAKEREIDNDAQRFQAAGYGYQFFGYISQINIPVDEVAEMVADYGLEEVQSALDFVIGD